MLAFLYYIWNILLKKNCDKSKMYNINPKVILPPQKKNCNKSKMYNVNPKVIPPPPQKKSVVANNQQQKT